MKYDSKSSSLRRAFVLKSEYIANTMYLRYIKYIYCIEDTIKNGLEYGNTEAELALF